MANNTERIINHQDALDMIDNLRGIKNAILGTAGNGDGDWSIAKILANIRNGAGPVNLPIRTELEFSAEAHVVTSFGSIIEHGTPGITAVSVTEETYLAVEGVHRGLTVRFVYDGSHWRLGHLDGEIVTLSDYGVAVTGTPAEEDYVDISETAATWLLQVADYDHYSLKDSSVPHHAVLMAKNALKESHQFHTPPMLCMANTKALMPAGKYKFTCYQAYDGSSTDGDKTYVFTITSDIPKGGGWYHSLIGKNTSWGGGTATDITTGKISTYGTDHKTTIETNISVSVYDAQNDSDAVDLGHMCSEYISGKTFENAYGFMNFTRRVRYGNGDYGSTMIRTYLNATGYKNTWFKMLSIFDIVPDWVATTNGFLHNVDNDLKGAMQKVKIKYYLQDSDYNLMTALGKTKPIQWLDSIGCSIDGRVVTVEDYVFLPSIVEVGLGNNYNDNSAGNTVLALYNGATNAERIKYWNGSAKYWWLRSPNPWNCRTAAHCKPGGTLNYSHANDSGALVPACVIG